MSFCNAGNLVFVNVFYKNKLLTSTSWCKMNYGFVLIFLYQVFNLLQRFKYKQKILQNDRHSLQSLIPQKMQKT